MNLYFRKSYYQGHIPTKQKIYIAVKGKEAPKSVCKRQGSYLHNKNF